MSSLVAYDIYREYINPQATGAQILKVSIKASCSSLNIVIKLVQVSRVAIVVFGGLMGVLSVALEEMGLSLGWCIYYSD